MIRQLSNGAIMTWGYEPDLMLLTAMITDVVEGQPHIVIADAYVLEPTPDQQVPDLIRDSLNTFESEYLTDYHSIGASLDYGFGDSETLCAITATVVCDLCAHEWYASFPDDLERIECPNCENMVNFDIKE